MSRPEYIFYYESGEKMDMNLFGELLKEARKRARLSQQALADKVGVDDSYISKMENGVDKPPSRDVAVKLAGALGIINKITRFFFFLAAYVAGDEDMQGLIVVEVDEGQALGGVQPAIAGALGAGVGLGVILPRERNIGFLVKQTVDEFQLTPEKRMLAERLILENARSICEVLAKDQD
jgi:transcriptional regulator with XRE-family HTH domain